jgi:hypothetical protein
VCLLGCARALSRVLCFCVRARVRWPACLCEGARASVFACVIYVLFVCARALACVLCALVRVRVHMCVCARDCVSCACVCHCVRVRVRLCVCVCPFM